MGEDATAGGTARFVDSSLERVQLEAKGMTENTLVIFTSDNGITPQADIAELTTKGHRSSYRSRGRKAEIYDGGHHVPFIVRWPARVAAGTASDALVCLTDLMATCAAILGKTLPERGELTGHARGLACLAQAVAISSRASRH